MIQPGSTIHTDGAIALERLAGLGYTHHYTTGYTADDPDETSTRVSLEPASLQDLVAALGIHDLTEALKNGSQS